MNVEESIQLFLSSKNATSYNNGLTSDCNFFLPMIELPSQHYIYISVVQCSIPYTLYQTNASNNNFDYSINNVQYHLVISPGNYNAFQIVTWINTNTQLTATYDIISNKFTFTNATFAFNFLSTSTCLDQLGMSGVFPAALTLKSDKCVNLLTTSCICLHSNLLTGNFTNNDKNDNTILMSLPIDSPPYSIISFSNMTSARSCLYTNTISFINIRLLDQNNLPIDLNGCHFSLTLNIEVVNFA